MPLSNLFPGATMFKPIISLLSAIFLICGLTLSLPSARLGARPAALFTLDPATASALQSLHNSAASTSCETRYYQEMSLCSALHTGCLSAGGTELECTQQYATCINQAHAHLCSSGCPEYCLDAQITHLSQKLVCLHATYGFLGGGDVCLENWQDNVADCSENNDEAVTACGLIADPIQKHFCLCDAYNALLVCWHDSCNVYKNCILTSPIGEEGQLHVHQWCLELPMPGGCD